MRLLTADIGLKTCSLCIEDYDDDIVKQVEFPAKKNRYNKDGSSTEAMCNAIKAVGKLGHIIHLDKRELGNQVDMHNNIAFLNLYTWLDELYEKNLLNDVDIILIEQQMLVNKIAQAIMYHMQAYFLLKFRSQKAIILYPSKNKTRIIGMQLKLENGENTSKYQRKQFSIKYIEALLKERKDDQFYNYIFVENKKKKDDLSDVVMMSLAYTVQQIIKDK